MQNNRTTWGPAHYVITRTDGTSHETTVTGRWRWALEALLRAGLNGCTPLDQPGPRWSAYVHTLRHEHRVEIETVYEKHGGPFGGNHARYVIRSDARQRTAGAVEGVQA